MNLRLLLYFAFLLLSSCKKEITTTFPQGTWTLKEFVVNESKWSNYSCRFEQANFENLINTLNVTYDNNHLNFTSEKSDDLKIIKSENIHESISFCENYEKNFLLKGGGTVSNYTLLTLRTKKLKKIKFTFAQLNDSLMIGEFWVKNQALERYDAPNMTSGEWEIENINIKGPISTPFKSKIMGVYKLEK